MFDILTKITEGRAKMKDLNRLEKLTRIVKETSLCGLGQTAPNPVLTTIKYFREEYEAHIKYKSCPALVCEKLIEYHIDADACIGCGICKKNCTANAISGEKNEPYQIISDFCINCGVCYSSCPKNAIYKTTNQIK